MSDLVVRQPTREQVLAMADGLMARGQHAMAAQLYRWAAAGASPARSLPWRVRSGLASAPSTGTAGLMDALRALEGVRSSVFLGEGLATWEKTLPFMEDARFLEIADRHAHLLPVANWHWNLHVALWAAREALQVEGDFVELGVFKGHTTLFLADYLDFAALPRTWRLYDTFAGIPADQMAAGWEAANADLYGGTYTYEEVAERFGAFPNIRVIQGRAPEILDTEPPGRIAFLHVDLNNPAAEVAALERLFDRVSAGGVILLDDYGWLKARAQYDAERPWFEARGVGVLHLPTGQGLVVKR